MKCLLKICLILVILVLIPEANPLRAAVLEVRPPSDGIGVLGDVYPTIQAAIDAASPNDIIVVHSATYTENIDVNKPITLQVASGDTVTVNALSSSVSVFTVNANNVTISGFTVSGATGGGQAGIFLSAGVADCNILDNILTGNFDGIWLGAGSNHNTLANNTLSGNYQGFEVYISSDNNFTNNDANSNTKYGFKIDSGNNNTFTGNKANSNSDKGFYSVAGDGGGSTNSTFTNNTANSNTRHGIHLIGSNVGATLTGNTFNANLVTGIKLQDTVTGLDIQNNNITNNPTGIGIDSSVTGVDGLTVTNNCISGNTNYGVSNAGTGTLDATNNSWGDPTGPYHAVINEEGLGNAVSDNVDIYPWYVDCTFTTPVDLPVHNVTQDIYYHTIQAAINSVQSGDLIVAQDGPYDETLDIDGVTNITIQGQSKENTILKSSTTIGLNVGPYTTDRQTMVRIVNSTDILIQNMTIDCDLIKGSNRYGVFGWDSEVTLNNSILKNASVIDTPTSGYGDITTYFRAPGFDDTTRAQVSVTNCTFIDPGRLAILVHDYVNIDVSGNTFYKTFDDFGYAMEIGSQSTGSITGNTIYGYDIPAASDGSSSAGIYIENSFTGSIFGGSPHVDKDILLQDNEIYDCQYAMTVGNEWNGYAGDVDIQVVLQGNNYHDNVSGGIIVADEDAEDGSSVTITGSDNTIIDNNEFAYFVYTFGDGDITIDLSGDTLNGNQYGMYSGDYASGTSTSSYSIAVSCSQISGNSEYGIYNDIADITVNAINNWWGSATGPGGAGGGSGDNVSANVDFFPWLLSIDGCDNYTQVAPDYVVDDDWALLPDWATVTVDLVDYYIGLNAFDTIQEAVNAASDGNNISVAAGTYNEAVLIEKSLNIRGATANLNKNGYPVPDGYAWDDEIESIINHPNPTVAYNAVVDIHDVNDVTFQGFVVQELHAVGNLNTSLVRVYAHTKEISGINVRNNVIGGNTNVAAQNGAQGRMGLYIVNHPYSDKGVVNSSFAGNKIFDCKGNGDNIFIWSSYFAYGAPGPASMAGTVIEDNEIYGSHRAGIETAGGFSGLTIRYNSIYGNTGLPSDDPNHLKYGNGILLIRGSSDKLGGATTAYGPVNLTIKGNQIFGNEKNGIYTDPILSGVSITGNDIYDNGWDAVRVDLEGTYWNPTFEPEPGQWSCYDGASDVEVSFNNIFGNGAGVELIGTPTNGLVIDATYNWWGDVSGPKDSDGTVDTDGTSCPDVSDIQNADGLGNAVSEYVDYCPWLLMPIISSDSPCPAGDLDGDCDVDFADLAILANNWLVGTE